MSLDQLVPEINACFAKAHQYAEKAAQFHTAAGYKLVEAHAIVEAAGEDWTAWHIENIDAGPEKVTLALTYVGRQDLVTALVVVEQGVTTSADQQKKSRTTRASRHTGGKKTGRPKGAITKVAEKTGLHRDTVRAYVKKAKAAGKVVTDDPTQEMVLRAALAAWDKANAETRRKIVEYQNTGRPS